ncbi:hypothetical protein [Streptomyces sp. NRRL S-350]|uniref:hypothetical protein n=1 Tax=Streptomyces sp. NRRL S-350 TaxID=1463902 RepID=UPI0004BE9D20|nr:hypothetical protein [Streptomyces sp. NRRL S-350]
MEIQMHARCWHCAATIITPCPDCVLAVRVDPQTNRLVGHVHEDGWCTPVTPTPEEQARSVKKPVCDGCASRWGARTTTAERHRVHAQAEGLYT